MKNILKKSFAHILGFTVLFSVLFITACGGSSSSGDGSAGTATLTGSLTDDALDSALAAATVTAAGKTVTTDTDGTFSITGLSAGEDVVVSASKDGYVTNYALANLYRGVQTTLDLSIAPVGTQQTIDATLSNDISDDISTLTIPANSLVTADGSAFTGTATITYTDFDPVVDESFPGDYEGVREDGSVVPVMSYGYVNVVIEDSEGNDLNLGGGATATISYTVPSSLLATAPATIPMWYFNETSGIWEEEGVATLTAGKYVAEVSHFSTWNFDIAYDVAYLDISVTNCLGEVVPNARVKVHEWSSNSWSTVRYTDANGHISKAPIRPDVYLYIDVLKDGDTVTAGHAAVSSGTTAGASVSFTKECPEGTAVIGHYGYDFSTTTSGGPYSDQDGWTNTWGCGDSPTSSGIFWCPSSTNTNAVLKDMGEVTLSSVTTVPTSWDSPIEALQLNHVYVANTNEGYVKFKVLHLMPESWTWDVAVEYELSQGDSFTQ